jgi:hypothetical protein
MFEALSDPELVAMLAVDEQDAAGFDAPAEPDWTVATLDGVYAGCLTGGDLVSAHVSRRPSPLGLEAAIAGVAQFASLNLDQQVDLLLLIERQRASLDALHQQALGAFSAADSSDLQWSREQAAAALRVSPRAMPRRIATATTLMTELPQTMAALSAGTITREQASTIAVASWTLPADVTSHFEERVLEHAGEQTLPELRRTVEQARIAADPATADQRHHKARGNRGVGFCPLPDGMASLAVLLPATDADAIYRRLTAAARLLPAEDPRSPDQQRADLLVDAVLTGLPVDALPQAQGRKPGINLHASLSTVAGLDDEPGYLDGYGPITAQELRRLAFAADATWRRMVTDPVSGHILDYGRTTYRPPQPLIDLTIARAQVCAFPGCHQPGHHCDIDHIVPYGEQGETCPANTAPLCRRHHRCKTRGPFRYRLNRDGSHSWQLDSAHTYTSRPPVRLGPNDYTPWEQKVAAAQEQHNARRDAAEDASYAATVASIRRDLDLAVAAQDPDWQQAACTALAEVQRQRTGQLARRRQPRRCHSAKVPDDLPVEPPF